MANQDQNANERNYIAFISYRHKPLDLSVAKKLHRRIERYVIPKELRGCEGAAGGSRLGLVFRDQDELPISNNLTENIRTALDHAKFLIVVCSKDTPESLWVRREISYFLEHHDRDHLLAILIDGGPEESFPPQLTEVRDEEGNLIETVEPLAANIVADSELKRNRLFQTESLRILASLIGCPYDALYHREQRYRMRRMGIAAAAGALVAAGFIGMLLNRNAKIREQLMASMINESRALAALSESSFRDGDYRGALGYALDALPGRDPQRPYVAEAEKSLSDELYLYRGDKTMGYVQSLEQDTDISGIALSADGSRFAAGDRYGYIRVFDMKSGQLTWSAKAGDSFLRLYYVENTLLVSDGLDKIHVYSEGGELLRRAEDDYVLDVNAEKGMYLSYSRDGSALRPFIKDVKTGNILYELGTMEGNYFELDLGAVSPDGLYCAVLAKYASDEQGADLLRADLVQLVHGAHDVPGLLRQTLHGVEAGEDLPVVHPDAEPLQAQGGEGVVDDGGDLRLVGDVQLAVADDVDVGLVELPEAAPLGPLAPVDLADLIPAEGEGQLAVVESHVFRQGHGEIKAQRQIAVPLLKSVDLLFRLAAALGQQHVRPLDHRSVQGGEAVEGIAPAEGVHESLHLLLRGGQELHKAGESVWFDTSHTRVPFKKQWIAGDSSYPLSGIEVIFSSG